MKPFTFQPFKTVLFAAGATMLMWTTACKKDAFDEKAALTAQRDLLQFKYDNEKSLEQLRQQGATALAQLQYQLSLQQQMLTMRSQDSLNRAYQRFVDSLSRATGRHADSISMLNNRRQDIIVKVQDIITAQAIQGATVTLPTTVGTVLQATTDAGGQAIFPAAGNTNVPPTVQAIVTRTGYVSAQSTFITRTSSSVGQATVQLWNNGNARNTIRGNVTIDVNLANGSAENVSGQLITITNSYQGTTYFYSALTDVSGNYSINVPDNGGTIGAYSYVPVVKDSVQRMYVNGLVPGIDSIPSVQNVPARFTLGSISGGTQLPSLGGLAGSVPTTVSRFHAAINEADSNGRSFYVKNLFLNGQQDPINGRTNVYVGGFNTPNNGVSIDANNQVVTGTTFTSRYPVSSATSLSAPTTTPTQIAARFVDLMNNSDNFFSRVPSIQANIAWSSVFPTSTASFATLVNNTNYTFPAGNFATFVFNTRSSAAGNVNGFNPNAWGIVNGNLSGFNFQSYTVTNRAYVNSTGNLPSNFTVSGGQTITNNLTFGVGVLQQGVR